MQIEAEGLAAAGKSPIQKADGTFKFAAAEPSHPHVKSVWAQVPGNLSHVGQPNERSGLSNHQDLTKHAGGSVLCHAYTSERSKGLIINDFRLLVEQGAQFVGLSLADLPDNEAWANDGGPSVFHIFVDEAGGLRFLAKGGLEVQSEELHIDPSSLRMAPNVIVIRAGSN
ncbi:hypothetical protein [Rhizobium terrae]|uniref:hypothetical protein n=1 Tax=Rhizobium terrae TaxID=2171756 RepID=UPI000E3D7D1C|nr:hypothetical protein [Rhizobium terrae]